MTRTYATGSKALGICDRCGRSYNLLQLHEETENRVLTNRKVCPQCLDEDHPQYQLGRVDASDPQALLKPRPDTDTGA
jgi:hypothetical protein